MISLSSEILLKEATPLEQIKKDVGWAVERKIAVQMCGGEDSEAFRHYVNLFGPEEEKYLIHRGGIVEDLEMKVVQNTYLHNVENEVNRLLGQGCWRVVSFISNGEMDHKAVMVRSNPDQLHRESEER